MSNLEFPCTMVTLGTVQRLHPDQKNHKGKTQMIPPNTRFECPDQETFDRLTSRQGRALPTARLWEDSEAAPPPSAELSAEETAAAKALAEEEAAAKALAEEEAAAKALAEEEAAAKALAEEEAAAKALAEEEAAARALAEEEAAAKAGKNRKTGKALASDDNDDPTQFS